MKKLICIALSFAMIISLIPTLSFAADESVFKDVRSDAYYFTATKALAELELINGYEDGTFKPEDGITRAEMAAIVCRMTDTETVDGVSAFDDVEEKHWAKSYINAAAKKGIVEGDGNGKFRPSDEVKYEEALKMVVCALGLADGIKTDASDWSKPYLELAKVKGISDNLKGEKGKAASRADVAVMVYNGLMCGLSAPTASLEEGSYRGTQSVTLSTSAPGVEIYYTLNGSTPTTKSIKYTKAIKISTTATLKAVSVLDGVLVSDVAEFDYTITRSSGGGSSTKYTVSFDLNYDGAEGAPEKQRIKRGDKAIEPPTPMREGYKFIGWSTSKNEENLFDFATDITKKITLYALWEEKTEAEKYYENNSELIEIINVEEAEDVLTETEATSILKGKGFTDYPVTYKYSLSGEYCDEKAALETSNDKHPMYQTFYMSESGDGWTIYVINGETFAYPVSFNLESDLGVELFVATSETVTSYDNITNKFYYNIPHESAAVVEIVDNIDAETLDRLTIEEICRLSGATMPVTANDESTELLSQNDFPLSSPAMNYSEEPVEDPIIVVSLGDSYSSGEGIEEFYGQDKPIEERVKDEDWLAHRSTKSWPSLLHIPGMAEGDTLANYNVKYTTNEKVKWYFAAASGAKTWHFKNEQTKEYNRDGLHGTKNLPPQLAVFDKISGDVDYVTLTIGGNDIGFADIIKAAYVNCVYLHFGETAALEDIFTKVWNDFDFTKSFIKQVYKDIEEKAGKQANIIVAGYPKLLCESAAFNWKEQYLININVTEFNNRIKEIVRECRDEGMNIYFVDVETEFDKDGGHQAYSDDPWIKEVIIGAEEQDLRDSNFILWSKNFYPSSDYSIHPTERGAIAYADCVNKGIAEIEKMKKTINVVVTDSYGRPLPDVKLTMEYMYLDTLVKDTGTTDSYGQFLFSYRYGHDATLSIEKEGFIPQKIDVKIDADEVQEINIIMKRSGEGTASGTIWSEEDGNGIDGLTLHITNSDDELCASLETSNGGKYETPYLKAGEYLVEIIDEREGIEENQRYDTAYFNIEIAAGEEKGGQDYTMNSTIDIVGTVTDIDGNVIENAALTLNYDNGIGERVYSDNSGKYEFSNIPKQHGITMEIEKDGYVTENIQVDTEDFWDAKGTYELNIELEKTIDDSDIYITGVVTDEKSDPVDGAEITLDYGDGLGEVVYSGNDGKYKFTNLPKKNGMTIKAVKDGYETVSVDISDNFWEIDNYTCDIALKKTGGDNPPMGEIVDSGTCGAAVVWNLYEDGTLVISGEGNMYDKYSDSTKFPWHGSKNNIKSVIVKGNVQSISGGAFYKYPSIQNVTIADSVNYIGSSAFDGCVNLTDVRLPNRITEIKPGTFYGCTSLKKIVIPEGVKGISGVVSTYPSNGAFGYCTSLEEVILPKSLTSINGFHDCTSLKSINLPDGLTAIAPLTFSGCSSLESVKLPNNLEVINYGAFEKCKSLSEINFPESISSIENNAFYGCSALKSLTFTHNIKSIGNASFSQCDSLKKITIPDTICEVGNNAFWYCSSLEEVTVEGNIEFGEAVFAYNDSLAKVNINSSTIGVEMFKECPLLSQVNIGDNVEEIGDRAFHNCDSLKSITIPGSVKSVGGFSSCENLTDVTICDGVSNIKQYAFQYSGLTSITIPGSIIDIGASAFYGCKNLKNAIMLDGVTSIGKTTFEGCHNLTTVDIPNSVTSIGEAAFRYCDALTSITIPGSITDIVGHTFSHCSNLESVIIRDGVTSIAPYMFEYCSNLTSVDIPNSVTCIADGAFWECKNLTNIAIPGSVTEIGSYAFYNTGVTSAVMPGSVEKVGSHAFPDLE